MEFIQKYLSQLKLISETINHKEISNVAHILKKIRGDHGRLFLIGSGGGAGHASHATCDFRKLGGFNAYCPLDNVSELTARVNDEGWETSIANHLIVSQINSNDCLFVFSVGGGSEEKNISTNLVNAIKLAKQVGAKVVGIVGKDGGFTAKNSDACILIPTVDDQLITPHTEGMQAVVWHLLISHPELKLHQTKWESLPK
ncbi:MAG TPA: SIS domain-containing protein [Chlamydiales bacterium]|nr:SIS domain-containing protein [Chlamydiales bacterium]